MKLLIQIFGENSAIRLYNKIKREIPNMHEDYYVRNIVRTYSPSNG